MSRFEYPYWDLETAIEIAKVVSSLGDSAKVGSIADSLKMTESGGAFRTKITAARIFGLVTGKSVLQLTPLAKKFFHPVPGENPQDALQEAFLSPPLFRKLYNRFAGIGHSFPDLESLKNLLAREYDMSQKVATFIAPAFLKSWEFFFSYNPAGAKSDYSTSVDDSQFTQQGAVEHLGATVLKLSLTGFGPNEITIETMEDWETVDKLLSSLKKKWKEKRVKSE